MIPSQPARTRTTPARATILAVLGLLATAAVGVAAVPPDGTRTERGAPEHLGAAWAPGLPTSVASMIPAGNERTEQRTPPSSLGDDGHDGSVRGGVTVFDDRSAAVANLDPALLGALRSAAKDAARDRVEFVVNSGWRSAAYQEQLLQEAVVTYGSKEEAERWVATPETSAHVSGDAVDLGPTYAASWLAHHGAAYGLCQVYRNEPWHYELRPGAVDHGCPAMYADPTHDPRMQR